MTRTALTLALCTVTGPLGGQALAGPPAKTPSIIDVANSTPDLSTLVEAVQAAGLVEVPERFRALHGPRADQRSVCGPARRSRGDVARRHSRRHAARRSAQSRHRRARGARAGLPRSPARRRAAADRRAADVDVRNQRQAVRPARQRRGRHRRQRTRVERHRAPARRGAADAGFAADADRRRSGAVAPARRRPPAAPSSPTISGHSRARSTVPFSQPLNQEREHA